MSASFNSSSGFTRVLSVLVATIVTATLFAAVAFGLTGKDGWSLLAETPVATATVAA